MKIRKAAVADFERLQALYRAFSAELAAVAPDYYVEASQDFALFTGIVECPDADILIAEKDGVPVGAATVWVQERPLSPHVRFGRSLKISYLAVSDEAARDELIRAAGEQRIWRKSNKR